MTGSLLTDAPGEFEIPRSVQHAHLRRLNDAISAPARARRRPLRFAAGAAAATLLATAALATAASMGLFDRDVTRADIDARATTATRAITNCTAAGDCETTKPETRPETRILASDGITFVAPDGTLLVVTPASGTLQYEPGMLAGAVERSTVNGKEVVTVAVPDRGSRTISFATGEGDVEVGTPGADATTTVLRSGDVVPLLPGTLADQPLTPEKAVTFDLANGAAHVWIYPQRNEAYVGEPPWRLDRQGHAPSVPPSIGMRYRLEETPAGKYTLRHDLSGGRWTYETLAGATRTVSWRAGDAAVSIVDRGKDGDVLGAEVVSVGRRVDAG